MNSASATFVSMRSSTTYWARCESKTERTIYDWTKIDQLYDDLLARRIKPFVELGFTPNAMKTSDNKIFYWQGNTSHPAAGGVEGPGRCLHSTCREALWAGRGRTWFFEVWNEPEPVRILGRRRPEGLFRAVRSDI